GHAAGAHVRAPAHDAPGRRPGRGAQDDARPLGAGQARSLRGVLISGGRAGGRGRRRPVVVAAPATDGGRPRRPARPGARPRGTRSGAGGASLLPGPVAVEAQLPSWRVSTTEPMITTEASSPSAVSDS